MVRVLLDEDLDVRLRSRFGESVSVETVAYRGWKGLENGDLLRAAEADFDVLATMDRNLPYQRNLPTFDLAVIVLRARSKRLDLRLELMPELLRILPAVRPGEAVEIFPPRRARDLPEPP